MKVLSYIMISLSAFIMFLTMFILPKFKEEPENSFRSDVYEKYKYLTDINKEPIQESTRKTAFNFGEYEITPKYEYALKAKVLGKERYRLDKESDLSFFDLALGWKAMSKLENLEKIKITQSNRWYRWRIDSFFISRNEIEHNSANTHIIHANDFVLSKLKKINIHDDIELYGYLVSVTDENKRWRWNSSTTRKDTGAGACEVFYVEEIVIR